MQKIDINELNELIRLGKDYERVLPLWYESIFQFGRDTVLGGAGIARAKAKEKKALVAYVRSIQYKAHTAGIMA